MKNRDMPAKPTTNWDNDFDKVVSQTDGLTKLEYAAIQIMAGYAVNESYTTFAMAEQAVVAAHVLFDELEKEQ